MLLTCRLSSRWSPRWHCGCFRAPLSWLTLDSWGDEGELMWEERSLVHGPLYIAVGEDTDTELTLEVRCRSMMLADVETSVHLCCPSWSYRPLPASPSCADLVNIRCEYSASEHGRVLTLAWRYWLMAFSSISHQTLSPNGSRQKKNIRKNGKDILVLSPPGIVTVQPFGILPLASLKCRCPTCILKQSQAGVLFSAVNWRREYRFHQKKSDSIIVKKNVFFWEKGMEKITWSPTGQKCNKNGNVFGKCWFYI